MSYDILYDFLCIRTNRGIIPMTLMGPNNVTTGGPHEKRCRDWSLWQSDMLEETDKKILDSVHSRLDGLDPDTQLYKKHGAWVHPAGMLRMFQYGIKRAQRIEDIYRADGRGMLSCCVMHYDNSEGPSCRTKIYVENLFINTTAGLEAWIDQAKPLYEQLKADGLTPWFSIRFSGDEPLKRIRSIEGPVMVKYGRNMYVRKYETDCCLSMSRDPANAIVFENTDQAIAEIGLSQFRRNGLRVFSAASIGRAQEKSVAIKIAEGMRAGYYLHKLTARRLSFTDRIEMAKKFASESEAMKWYENHRISGRFLGDVRIAMICKTAS